jgi:predicted 3-demethylubiquinone-9 3-methyltransferase (glyoxalase superfamily)
VRTGIAGREDDSMPAVKAKITPFLWFDTQAEEAATFYTSVFANSRITRVSRYGKAGHDTHGKDAGSVMTVEFELDGQRFIALNGGPHFKFTEAFSLQVSCDTQDEIDYFWTALAQGGQESRCGWLKDRYGLSWQVVPAALPQMLTDADGAKSERAMTAMLQMMKLDIAALQRARSGQA